MNLTLYDKIFRNWKSSLVGLLMVLGPWAIFIFTDKFGEAWYVPTITMIIGILFFFKQDKNLSLSKLLEKIPKK